MIVALMTLGITACDGDGASDTDTASDGIPMDTGLDIRDVDAVTDTDTDTTDTADSADTDTDSADADITDAVDVPDIPGLDMTPPDQWPPLEAGPSPYTMDAVLRLNHVQAKGTHNSYHLEPPMPVDPSHEYSHAPLDVQLQTQGVRQFELDLHLHYEDGFHVFHLPQGLDQETTCLRFVDCLQTIKTWSDANPWHLPIVVWLEPKDELAFSDPDYDAFSHRVHEIDDAILSVYPRWRILTPDDVRKTHADLPAALAAEGWPTLGELRGKIVFSMLDSGPHRDSYIAGNPTLEGRVLFVNSGSPSDPWAAFFKINDARGESARVQQLVADGFIITSNVDSADASDMDNTDKSLASMASGAHFLSSDTPAPVMGQTYFLDLPGAPARCNPINAPMGCTPAEIEALP